MKVILETISYDELRHGLSFEKDKHSILSYQYETRRDAFLANPFLNDYSMEYMLIGVAENEIIGRDVFFPVKFKMGGNIVDAFGGSSFLVLEEFRKDPIGAEMFMYKLTNKPYDIIVASGMSEMAIPFHKVTKRTIFQFPRFWQIRSSRSLFKKMGLRGLLLQMATFFTDIPIRLFNKFQLRNRINKAYTVEKKDIVPEWVEDVVMNDGHKYMELHNQKWFQWNLDYNFCGGENNFQSFYVINHLGKPAGFFMMKYREYNYHWRLKDVKIATIVEWGVCKGEILSEIDIIRFASETLKQDVDVLEFATTDFNLSRFFKRNLFLQMEDANISIKDIKKQYSDIKQMDLWRLRLGYADVVLST